MAALSTANIRWLFLSTINCNIWYFHLLRLQQHIFLAQCQYISWEFNTNVIPCLPQLKPKALLWMYNRFVQLIFKLAPNLLDGVEVWTCPSFSMFQQISSIVGSSANSLFYGIVMPENNWNLLNMPRVQTILPTIVYVPTIWLGLGLGLLACNYA